MATLEMNDDENEVLLELLESAISDLHTEIGHTDSADYRNALKNKRALVATLLERLRKATG